MSEKKVVVAVDDDPDILEFVTNVLSPDYDVKTGSSGSQCLEDCLRKLKEGAETRHIPVIMMTSVNEVYDYRSQIEESFYEHDRWLDKPVKKDVLLKTIRELVGP